MIYHLIIYDGYQKISSFGDDVEKLKLLSSVGGNVKLGAAPVESSREIPQITKK